MADTDKTTPENQENQSPETPATPEKEKTTKGAKAKAETPATPEIDPLEELVEVTLLYDGNNYVDDVDVCINGQRILIKRGETVKIKRKFGLVLEQSMQQDKSTRRLIMSLCGEDAKK